MRRNSWRGRAYGLAIVAVILGSALYMSDWPTLQDIARVIPALFMPLIPAWVFWFIAPFIVFIITLIYFIYSTREADIREPDFVVYTGDTIFDIHWSWRWFPPTVHGNFYTLVNLTPYCPSCSALLAVHEHQHPLVICPNGNCNWQWSGPLQEELLISTEADLVARVRTEIDRRTSIRNKK